MVGEIKIAKQQAYDFISIDKFMKKNFLFDLDADSNNEINQGSLGSKELTKSLLFWYTQIHQLAKMPVSDSFFVKKTASSDDSLTYKFAIGVNHPQASNVILGQLLQIFRAFLLKREPLESLKPAQVKQFLDTLKPFSLPGTNNRFFVQAAISLKIPYRVLGNEVIVFGYGKNMRRLSSSSTDKTSHIGVITSKNKGFTSNYLRLHALPVAPQFPADSLKEAVTKAKQLGYPVVIKPLSEDQGLGVTSNIKSENELRKIYTQTQKRFDNLIIEKHIFGDDYRFTVVNGEVIKIMHRMAGGVVGDGNSSIKSLVETLQNEPRNKRHYMQKGKYAISLDQEALGLLKENRYTPETVLEKGEYLCLRRQNNISTGGANTVIPNNEVHPDNLELAIKIAKLFHLDMAGVDLISEDITESWLTNKTIVCEVNAGPQIGRNQTPTIYEDILKSCLNDSYRIPVHLHIVKKQDLNSEEFFLSLIEQKSFKHFSIGNKVVVNQNLFSNNAIDSFHAAQVLLLNEDVDEANIFLAAETILKKGLPVNDYDSINKSADCEDIDELDEMIKNNQFNITNVENRD